MEELKATVVKPDDERIFIVAEMLRRDISKRSYKITGIDKFSWKNRVDC